MECERKLLLLLCLMSWCACGQSSWDESCSSERQLPCLKCVNDYHKVMNCTWNMSHLPGQVCELYYTWVKPPSTTKFNDSVCSSELKRCSLSLNKILQMFHVMSITLTCAQTSVTMNYKPVCHIKPNPPTILSVNLSTVSWLPRADYMRPLGVYTCELQWKRKDQPWSDEQNCSDSGICVCSTKVELPENELIRGEDYQMRVRVKFDNVDYRSLWSDWSPEVSWVAEIGRSPHPPDAVHLWKIIFAAAACGAVALTLVWSNKNKWVYSLKRVIDPPLPDPGKSFLKDVHLQNWQSRLESSYSPLQPVEILPVEILGNLHCVTPLSLMERFISERFQESNSSGFTNLSYAQVSSSPPSSATAGNPLPRREDSSYGQVQRERTEAEKVKLAELLTGILKEKPTEVSLESQGETGGLKSDKALVEIQRFFARGTTGGVFGTGSIQLCPGYKSVSRQQEDHVEHPSLDSGLGLENEDVRHRDDAEISNLPRHPPQASSPRSLPEAADLRAAQMMQLLQKMVATPGSMEPSCDGYKPVVQEQSD